MKEEKWIKSYENWWNADGKRRRNPAAIQSFISQLLEEEIECVKNEIWKIKFRLSTEYLITDDLQIAHKGLDDLLASLKEKEKK